LTPSAKVDPIWWTAKSEKGWNVTLDMPVNGESSVVRLREWHCTHPMLSNSADPFCADADMGYGVGGAARRMKSAKLTTSPDISDAVRSSSHRCSRYAYGLPEWN